MPDRTRSHRRHPALAWLAGFFVIVVGAEVAVRLAAPGLPEPLRYYSTDAQRVVDDMDVLQRSHVRSDLTFVGTSMVRRDIDATTIEHAMPGIAWAHSVALPGATTTIVERWMLQEVVPRLHPLRVVWGISSLDFNDGRPDHPIVPYDAARQTEPGFYGGLDRLIGQLAVSAHRDALRGPLTIERAAFGSATKFSKNVPLRERAVWKLGYPNVTPKQLAKTRTIHLKRVRDKQLANFHIGRAELDAFTHTLSTLKQQGIEVAVLIMPVSAAYIDAHPRGSADFDAWKATVEQQTTALGVTLIDMSRTMPDDAFRDDEHLSVDPAREFTRLVAARLEAVMR